MKQRRAGLILLVLQLLLVLSVAGKYLYERKFCPRVWTRAAQFDPSLPLRGRYLALQLLIDACSLPRDARYYTAVGSSPTSTATAGWSWPVTAEPVNGRLVARLVDPNKDSVNARHVRFAEDQTCIDVPFDSSEIYFIPDTARSPFPLQPGQELWVEVTLPPAGPPRAIQLAISDPSGFHPLKFE
jgi:hypothetical protein